MYNFVSIFFSFLQLGGQVAHAAFFSLVASWKVRSENGYISLHFCAALLSYAFSSTLIRAFLIVGLLYLYIDNDFWIFSLTYCCKIFLRIKFQGSKSTWSTKIWLVVNLKKCFSRTWNLAQRIGPIAYVKERKSENY